MAWYRTESDDHDGREYYINADTKESSWDLPPMFAWKRLNGNSKFYFNTITAVSYTHLTLPTKRIV